MSNNQDQPLCQNCNTVIGCSCQRRTASDGKAVCSNCVTSYEMELKALRDKIADIRYANEQQSQ